MLWRTHFITGAAAGVVLSNNAGSETMAISAGIAGLAALFPDIDNPYSKLGRMVPVIPRLLQLSVGHRGMMHSPAAMLMIILLLAALSAIWALKTADIKFTLPLIMVGYLSHLVLDSLSGKIPWLWPLQKSFGVSLVKTGGLLEKLIVTPLTLIVFLNFINAL